MYPDPEDLPRLDISPYNPFGVKHPCEHGSTAGGQKQTKLKMEEDEDDKDDGFMNDLEMLREEQTAASKDVMN
jgi:hypothetical protein